MIINSHLHESVLSSDIRRAIAFTRENKTEVNSLNSRGETPILNAVAKGDLLMTQLLVDSGADLTRVNRDGWNVLHYAVHSKRYDMIRFVIEHLVCQQKLLNVKTENHLGHTPFHFAQCPFIVEHVALLLTLYGKQQGLQEDNCLNECSVDIQNAIEHHMFSILMARYYKMQWLDNTEFQNNHSSNRSIIRSILFMLPSLEEKGDMERLMAIAREDNPAKCLDWIEYSAIFKNYPIFELYSGAVFHSALVDLLMQLKRYMQQSEEERAAFQHQITQVVQYDVSTTMAYYKKHTAAIQSRPFSFT